MVVRRKHFHWACAFLNRRSESFDRMQRQWRRRRVGKGDQAKGCKLRRIRRNRSLEKDLKRLTKAHIPKEKTFFLTNKLPSPVNETIFELGLKTVFYSNLIGLNQSIDRFPIKFGKEFKFDWPAVYRAFARLDDDMSTSQRRIVNKNIRWHVRVGGRNFFNFLINLSIYCLVSKKFRSVFALSTKNHLKMTAAPTSTSSASPSFTNNQATCTQLRPLLVEYCNLSRVDASAVFSQGRTVIQAALIGPEEIPSHRQDCERTAFSCMFRKAQGTSKGK